MALEEFAHFFGESKEYVKTLSSTLEADKCLEMMSKIKYDEASPEKWRLKSPDEVLKLGKGNCHDTAYWVYNNLDKYAAKKVKKGILFFIEQNTETEECGTTHSLCYEVIPGGVCWIECSWGGMIGTFPYNSIEEICDAVFRNWTFKIGYNALYGVEITDPDGLKPGMSLMEYVGYVNKHCKEVFNKNKPTSKPITEAFLTFEDLTRTADIQNISEEKYKKLNSLKSAKSIAKRIHEQVEKDSKPPTGNQNCQLCTWCAEAQFRGIDALPRPIYSPRDPALNIVGETIVKDPVRKHFSSFDNLEEQIQEIASDANSPYARIYCHVNWEGSEGGHEFLILKIDNKEYTMDAQAGTVDPLSDTDSHFKDINYDNSYIARLDNREFNTVLFDSTNDPSQTLPWDEEKDIEYMRQNGMLSKEDEDALNSKEDSIVRESVRSSGSETEAFYKSLKTLLAEESIERVNDKGDPVPEVCDKCGSKVGIYLHGEPVWLCSNKKCKKYYGTVPCNITEAFISETTSKAFLNELTQKENNLTIMELNTYAKKCISDDRGYAGQKGFSFTLPDVSNENPHERKCHEYFLNLIKDINKSVDKGEWGMKWIFYEKNIKKFFQSIGVSYNKDRVVTGINTKIGRISFLKKEVVKIPYNPSTDILVHRNDRSGLTYLKPTHISGDGMIYPTSRVYFTIEKRSTYKIEGSYGNKAYEFIPNQNIDVFYDTETGENRIKSADGKYGLAVFVNTFKPLPVKPLIKEPESIQEGAWQDIKNGVNPFSKNLVFHISQQGHYDGQIFKPRVPEYLDKYDPTYPNFEDVDNPRVCFSPSIEGALNAIMLNIGRWKSAERLKEWYVYIPEKPLSEYKHRTTKQLIKEKKVYDANVTNEIWIEEPVRLKQYGVIRIDQVSKVDKKKTVPMTNGKSGTRNRYTFKWHWLVKPKVIKDETYDYSPKAVCGDLVNDSHRYKYGLISDGKLMTGNVSEKDYNKYWVLHSPEEFDEAKGGNCYDYVEWASGYLDAYGVKCDKYFIKGGNNHAFITVESDNKIIFIDWAFHQIDSKVEMMKEFDSLNEVFDYILTTIRKHEKNDSLNFTIYDYTKEKMEFGTSLREFENWITSHGKKVKLNKTIKEEFNMSDFVRDPSVYKMILEAEAEEEAEEKGDALEDNDDENPDNDGDAIETSVEGEVEIGVDVGDVQNEYNDDDIDMINKLINSETSAISEYFNAAKTAKEPNLMRLYSDIGDEERFHLEQLLYAKATVTGEPYEPSDPKVKKEYQELLDMGLDEETAMTTAVDKVGLMPKEAMEDMSDDEAKDFEESFRMISSVSLQTQVMLEAVFDTSNISESIQESTLSFLDQMVIMEEVDNLNTRQGQKDLGTKNPIILLAKAFKAIYGFILNLARKAKLAFQKIRLRNKRKWAWIQKHGIGAIFAKGFSMYFYSEKKNMYDVGEPMRYLQLLHDMNASIINSCAITSITPEKYDLKNYMDKIISNAQGTSCPINVEPIAVRDIDAGIRILQGVSLGKTKVVLTNENQPKFEEQFFGYTKANYAATLKEGENSKNVRLSVNIYNQMSLLLDALTKLGSETQLIAEALANQEGTQNTAYDKNPGVWKKAVQAMSVIEKSVNKFNAAVSADISEMMKINQGLKEAMETADESGNRKAVDDYRDAVKKAQETNRQDSQKSAENADAGGSKFSNLR